VRGALDFFTAALDILADAVDCIARSGDQRHGKQGEGKNYLHGIDFLLLADMPTGVATWVNNESSKLFRLAWFNFSDLTNNGNRRNRNAGAAFPLAITNINTRRYDHEIPNEFVICSDYRGHGARDLRFGGTLLIQ